MLPEWKKFLKEQTAIDLQHYYCEAHRIKDKEMTRFTARLLGPEDTPWNIRIVTKNVNEHHIYIDNPVAGDCEQKYPN